jgi:hypothetical protein
MFQVRKATALLPHPGFSDEEGRGMNNSSSDNDVGLILLDSPLEFNGETGKAVPMLEPADHVIRNRCRI